MDKEVAEYVVRVAFGSESSLNDLIPLLKEHCSDEEYKKFSKRIASVSARISLEILDLVYDEFPEIRRELDEKVRKYGRLI